MLRWFVRALLAALVVLLALQLWYFGWIVWWKWNDPRSTAFMRREQAVLQARDPKAQLKHQWVPYGRISIHLKRAVIASEDARFTEHEGVDWEAIGKAYQSNAEGSRRLRGGSTITQQLAKNLFLSPDRSYVRKAQELVIAYMIEAVWDKRRILEVYLNTVEWGNGVFGAEAAARHYHGVAAAALGPEQSARLAAMLPRPKFFDRNRGSQYLAARAAAIQRYADGSAVP